jgi:hypothetical protein
MKKNTYYVTMTYLNTIEAKSYEEAENLTIKMIEDGDLAPNEIETEIAKDTILQADNFQYKYEYSNLKFKFQEDVIDALIEDEEIFSFRDWLNDNYKASDIYENEFEDLDFQYEDYKEDVLNWCIQVGKVKVLG